jgi:hypothetical protein
MNNETNADVLATLNSEVFVWTNDSKN